MENPLVSVVIRTCGRPRVLAGALDSIRAQSYKNIEIIIIEDGENISGKFTSENYSDLNINYQYTGEKYGRCRAGNLGMAASNGKYINFLDDDDYLLPNHIETLVTHLENSDCLAAYAIAEEHQIRKSSHSQEENIVKRKLIRYQQPYNKLLLCYLNYIPIQSIMFNRILYVELGGFDEKLKVLEDWDLWVRYSAHGDFLFIPAITSVYHTPYKSRQKHQRESSMQKASQDVIKKHQQYHVSLTVSQINRDMDYILNVFNKKGILFYMQKIRNFLLYRDI